jgi:serine protease
VLFVVCGVAFGVLSALVVRAQIAGVSDLQIVEGLGLPAVDLGVLRRGSGRPMRPAGRAAPTGRRSRSGARYASGKVIVRFRDAVPVAARRDLIRLASRSAALSAPPAHSDFDLVSIDPGEDPETVAAALRGRPDVEYAQAAYIVRPSFVPNDQFYSRQWDLPLIDLERAWDIQLSLPRCNGTCVGSAVTVAVLDTGVAYTSATITKTLGPIVNDAGTQLPALGRITMSYSAASQLVSASTLNRIVSPHDFVSNTNLPLDFDGHGTHVAGTIGQLTNDGTGTAGVAFNVKLMPVKVICGDWDVFFGIPEEICGTDDQVALGIRYAADMGAKVINLSLGRDGPPNCGTNPGQDGCAPSIESAIRYAVGKGAFIAIAAGNSYDLGNPTQVLAEIASRVDGAVAVAAVGVDKRHAYYSSAGPWVELAAPGGGCGELENGYVYQQTFDPDRVKTFDTSDPSGFVAPRFDIFTYFGYCGTSQATPHVAGVAAMLMQQGLTDPAAIELVLERSAIPCDLARDSCNAAIAPNRNDNFGYGLLDAGRAIRGFGLAR